MKSFIREAKRKDNALTKIREDLDDWSAGRSTPVQRFFVTAWVFMILTGGGLFVDYWPVWGWFFLAVWFVVCNLVLRKLIPR
jgi:Flp pilus assembly protein TadB